jgi:DNA ligase-1
VERFTTRFGEFSSVLEQIKATTSKNEKVRLLSEFIQKLDEEDVRYVARFATGRASMKGSEDETQVGYATILEVLHELTRTTSDEMKKVYLKYGDLGDLASEVLERKKETALFSGELSVRDVAEIFDKISSAKGKGSVSLKKNYLKALLLRATPVESKYIIKILTREMRIGLVDGLVEEAISNAYSLDKDLVREAHLLLGDIGLLAYYAKTGRMSDIRLQKLRPTNFMLAESMKDAREIADYFSKEVYGEYKYDGVRAQLHKEGNNVKLFSRRLEDISTSFPEIIREAVSIPHDFIIDGEIVAFRDEKPLSFQLLQRRLRRIEGFDETVLKIPVRYFCFDILLLDAEELYKKPLSSRRSILANTIPESGLHLAESKLLSSEEEIERSFRMSRDLGYEGLVIKDPEGPYILGKRGKWWVKLKEEFDTIDAVIVAAEYGHGKRAGVISDYTFAVKDGEELKVIGKAYSGLTDKEIDEMTTRIKEITIEDYGHRRSVKAEIVIEVAFDSIQRSDRHDSGFALRFPRIKRIRHDKSINGIDLIEKVERIYESQKARFR